MWKVDVGAETLVVLIWGSWLISSGKETGRAQDAVLAPSFPPPSQPRRFSDPPSSSWPFESSLSASFLRDRTGVRLGDLLGDLLSESRLEALGDFPADFPGDLLPVMVRSSLCVRSEKSESDPEPPWRRWSAFSSLSRSWKRARVNAGLRRQGR